MTAYAARIWFAFLGAAVAWLVQFMAGYALVEVHCKTDVFAFRVLGVPGFTLVLVLGSAVFAAMAVLAGLAALRTLSGEGWGSASRERQRFMAYTGLVMSALFTLLIVLTALSMAFIPPCD